MVLRTALGAAAAALLLPLLPGPAPAHATALPERAPSTGAAGLRPHPLEGLELHPEWGTITGEAGVLRRGCRTYSYSYAITPPEGIWAIEVYISGPRLKHLAAGAFLDGYDPMSGSGHYTLCKATTRYGTFRIEAKVSIDDGAGHIVEGRLPVDTYRLHRPRR
jgi:hypothetical protein